MDNFDNVKWNSKEPLWKKAVDFANKYHTLAGQYRIGKNGEKMPYITHIQEVIKILVNDAKITSDNILTVVALHDVLEDTSCTYEELEKTFGKHIAEPVYLLSKKEGQAFDDYTKILFSNKKYPWIGTIKLADRIHNLNTYQDAMNIRKVKHKYDETVRCIKPYAQKQSLILSQKLDESMHTLEAYLENELLER